MTHAIFKLDTVTDLPLWAQVFFASRMARRAALWLPEETPEEVRTTLLGGCDTLDACARAGDFTKADEKITRHAEKLKATRVTQFAIASLAAAADSALAARDSMDFAAAEPACGSSANRAMELAGQSDGLSPLTVRIMGAADVDLLFFACKESRIGRYDGLGKDVPLRLPPVHPPRPNERIPSARRDPTNGAR